MNQKNAKKFREMTGYRNAGKTPAKFRPLEIHHIAQYPLVERRESERKEWDQVTRKYTKTVYLRIVTALQGLHFATHDGKQIPMASTPKFHMEAFKEVEASTGVVTEGVRPKRDLIPIAKPVRLDPQSERGKYVELKKVARRIGVRLLAIRILNEARANNGRVDVSRLAI